MRTNIEILLFDTPQKNNGEDVYEAFAFFEKYEHIFSRFRENSELSYLNRLKHMKVSEEFLQVLEYGKKLHALSGGYFTLVSGAKDLVYEKSFESLERRSSQKITHRSELASMNLIQVEGNMVHIPENIQLDFGGIVKGYCVDRVRDFLRSKGYKNFLINAGGDIYVSGKISKTESCVIGIDSPLLDGELLASFELQDYSCSTSGTYKRNWTRDEQKFHHIVTPQNGGNSWEIESITLLAPDCAMSDGLATACIAMGYEKAKIFLESYGIPACIFLKGGAKASLGNWHEYRLSYAQ